MPTITLPYDTNRPLPVRIPDRSFLGVAEQPVLPAVADPAAEIRRALAEPVGSPPLRELARGRRAVTIAVTDITRYCPDDLVLPPVLDELARAGVPESAVTVVLGVGSHRAMTPPEIAGKLGPRVAERSRVVNHDWKHEPSLTGAGEIDGFPVEVNRLVPDAALRIATGVIEPHLFAGYSGGAKTMVIGAGGHRTIGATHGYEVLSHPTSRLGRPDSIFRRFINAAGDRLGIEFVVNLVIDPDKRLLRVFAGHPVRVFEAGVAFARRAYEAPVPGEADVVITVPGAPKNVNLYQATRACNSALMGPRPVLKKGGIVIVPTPCPDGLGSEVYREWLRDVHDGPSIVEKARTQGIPEDAHKGYQFGRYLTYASEVIITDCLIPPETIREVRLTPMATVQAALDRALARLGPDASVLVIPHGVVTLPVLPG